MPLAPGISGEPEEPDRAATASGDPAVRTSSVLPNRPVRPRRERGDVAPRVLRDTETRSRARAVPYTPGGTSSSAVSRRRGLATPGRSLVPASSQKLDILASGIPPGIRKVLLQGLARQVDGDIIGHQVRLVMVSGSGPLVPRSQPEPLLLATDALTILMKCRAQHFIRASMRSATRWAGSRSCSTVQSAA